jgi:type IV secretion system protein VirD4
VRELLTEPVADPDEAFPFGRGLAATAIEMATSPLPAIRNKAGQFARESKEVEGIISTADTQTEALDDAEIAADLSMGSLDFRELKTRPITVYLILPPDMIERHKRWLRLILSSALRGVMRPRKRGDLPVSFIIDEFAALGHLSIIEAVWALVRGYGIQLIPVLQDLNQLKALYHDRWETFIGMAGATVAFGPNDMTTAGWMSQRAGETTETVEGGSITQPRLFSRDSASSSISFSRQARPYLSVHDLFDTPEGRVYLWLAGVADVNRLYAPMYVKIRACRDLARANPYYLGED